MEPLCHATISASAPSPLPTILTLPAELTEHILIFTALCGFPTAISSFAQTCRTFRDLVYHSPDHHLWREIFLTIFDDPRRNKDKEKSFDWGGEFRRRIWTMNYIRYSTDLSHADRSFAGQSADAGSTADEGHTIFHDICVLETLISVVQTALPCPPTIVCSFLPSHDSLATSAIADIPGIANAYPSYPVFPPQPHHFLSSSSSCSSSCTSSSTRSTACAAPTSSSRNIAWFEDALRHGLPPALTALVSGTQWAGGVLGQSLDPPQARLMQLLGQVITYTGFLPVPAPGDEHPTSTIVAEASGPDERATSSARPPRKNQEDFITVAPGAALADTPDMSVLAQRRRARRLARMRVYNLRYLSARRGWGPFHPADEPPQAPVVVATAHDSEQGHDSDGESAEDNSERSGSDMDSESSDQHASDEDSAASDAGSAKGPSSAAPAPAPAPAPTQPGLPSDAQLYPDWAYLAAIRTIVEANLREAVGPNELNGLLWLDGLRMGSAPMDISEGAPVAADVAEPMVQFGQLKGKERAQSVNLGGTGASKPSATIPGEGWDWAGVTGVWRRCICWMDYRDLVLHNLSSQFDETSLQEAVRIVPMRLRVASYSPSSVAAYPDRPTIHFEGETAGTSANNQVRKVHGTVSVIADGSVKWAIKLEDSSLNWVSIGVQIGGPTTAMGVLGIWTGASHERVEPLGPFWAWKVG